MALKRVFQCPSVIKKPGVHTIASSEEGRAARLELKTINEQVEGNNVSSSASGVVLVRREATIQNPMSVRDLLGFKLKRLTALQ